jgi:hypothetical protein
MGASASSGQVSGNYGLFEFEADTLSKPTSDGVPYNVDIIAIHGITGDAYETWTHKNGNFGCRILFSQPYPVPGYSHSGIQQASFNHWILATLKPTPGSY